MGKARELRNRRTIRRTEILVPEWAEADGSPFKMWARPLTAYDMDQLQKKHPDIINTQKIGAIVDLIVLKAEDENGDRLFPLPEDRLDLMGEELFVLTKISDQMFADVQSMEAAEKNS